MSQSTTNNKLTEFDIVKVMKNHLVDIRFTRNGKKVASVISGGHTLNNNGTNFFESIRHLNTLFNHYCNHSNFVDVHTFIRYFSFLSDAITGLMPNIEKGFTLQRAKRTLEVVRLYNHLQTANLLNTPDNFFHAICLYSTTNPFEGNSYPYNRAKGKSHGKSQIDISCNSEEWTGVVNLKFSDNDSLEHSGSISNILESMLAAKVMTYLALSSLDK